MRSELKVFLCLIAILLFMVFLLASEEEAKDKKGLQNEMKIDNNPCKLCSNSKYSTTCREGLTTLTDKSRERLYRNLEKSSDALKEIRDLTCIEEFHFKTYASITLKPIHHFKNLKALHLEVVSISSLEPLSNFTKLRFLVVGEIETPDGKIKPRNITPLLGLKNLSVLHFYEGVNITQSERQKLENSLPNTKILFTGEKRPEVNLRRNVSDKIEERLRKMGYIR